MMTTTDIETAEAAPKSTQASKAKEPNKRRMARKPKADVLAAGKPAESAVTTNPRSPSKIAAVIALLERPEGATLAEMVEATGWLPHTTRAALTGLKKKGHAITKDKRDDVTCYRIAKAAR